MEIPENLRYTKDHEWVASQGDVATVGVTGFAVEQLGDIVHVDLPAKGTKFQSGETFGTIESTKTVSDLYMPVTGTVVELNDAICAAPEEVQERPYDKGWLVKVQIAQEETAELLDAAEYESYVKQQE
ncbi:MAG: glycine cleavage system protein GcvH [Zetaproteobacteria bacterium]|nr:glycine cleavage system protein GcvH [Zetaproteobacteria bacterium]